MVSAIDNLMNDVRRESGRISSLKIEADGLRLRRDGRLETSEGELRLDPSAVPRLAKYVAVPGGFLEVCSTPLRAEVFNEFLQSGVRAERIPSHMKMIIKDGDVLLGLADPDLVLLSSAEVFETVVEALPPELATEQLEIVDFHSNGEFRVAISTPQVSAEPRVGDVVRGGVAICHSPVGAFATQVSSHLFRLVCRNGLVIPTCQHDHRLRIRRALDENATTTIETLREVAVMAWTELASKLEALPRLAEETVADPEELIGAIARESGLSRRIAGEVVTAFNADELGGGNSLFDITNAFSRVGSHSERLSPRRRRMLLELSGELVGERVDKCPICGALRKQKYFSQN